jgi:hypothetical protein
MGRGPPHLQDPKTSGGEVDRRRGDGTLDGFHNCLSCEVHVCTGLQWFQHYHGHVNLTKHMEANFQSYHFFCIVPLRKYT